MSHRGQYRFNGATGRDPTIAPRIEFGISYKGVKGDKSLRA